MSRGDDGVRIVRGRRIRFVRRKFELDRRGRLRWVDALGRIHGLPCLDLGTWHSIVCRCFAEDQVLFRVSVHASLNTALITQLCNMKYSTVPSH